MFTAMATYIFYALMAESYDYLVERDKLSGVHIPEPFWTICRIIIFVKHLVLLVRTICRK